MAIMNAFCIINKKNMTIREIEEHPNYENVKEALICPNHQLMDCKAKLTFAKGNIRASHLRLHIGDSHSEDCEYYTQKNDTTRYIPSSEEISVTLTDKQLQERSEGHINDLLNPKTKSNSPKPKPRVFVTPEENTQIPKSKGVIDKNGNSKTTEELEEDGKNVTPPRIPRRTLNQIDNINEDAFLNIAGIAISANKKLEFNITYNGANAVLIFTEAFFASSPIDNDQLRDNLTILANYVNRPLTKRFEILIATLSDVKTNNNTKEILCSEYSSLSIGVKGYRNRALSLSNFVAFASRGNLNK